MPVNINKMKYVSQTVFIIGAGASNEIGMPTGSDLRKNIIDILIGIKSSQSHKDSSTFLEFPDHIIATWNSIYTYYNYDENNFKNHINILDEIIQSLELTSSIDNLLYDNRDNLEIQAIGKIAIVSSILKAESECALCNISNFNNIKPTMEGTWYYSLFLELNKQANLSEFIERLKNIYFIIFNYDRTLEYFLFNMIKRYYKTDDFETGKIIYNMNIYHPYGLPGFLEFQKGVIKNSFGNTKANNICQLSSMIKTFMLNKFNDDEEYKGACDFLYNADKVFFLGFAFHSQNIDLLFPQKVTKSHIKEQGNKAYISHSNYYGTFYNISQVNQNDIINKIKSKNERINNFNVSEKRCVDFFGEFSNYISFC
jgi:hypothetical protein